MLTTVQVGEADAARAAMLAAPGFVTHHRARLRTTTLWIGGLLTAYAVLLLVLMSPLLLELAQGPVSIEQAVKGAHGAEPASLVRRYVTLEETRTRGTENWGTHTWTEAHSFHGRWLRERRFEHRWAALTIPDDLELPTLVPHLLDGDQRLLVKTSIAQDTGDDLSWVGILSVLEPDANQPGKAGRQFIVAFAAFNVHAFLYLLNSQNNALLTSLHFCCRCCCLIASRCRRPGVADRTCCTRRR